MSVMFSRTKGPSTRKEVERAPKKGKAETAESLRASGRGLAQSSDA